MPIYYQMYGVCSEAEFIDIIINRFIKRDWDDPEMMDYLDYLRRKNPDYNLPQDFIKFSLEGLDPSLNDWLEFTDSHRINYM